MASVQALTQALAEIKQAVVRELVQLSSAAGAGVTSLGISTSCTPVASVPVGRHLGPALASRIIFIHICALSGSSTSGAGGHRQACVDHAATLALLWPQAQRYVCRATVRLRRPVYTYSTAA